MCVSVQVCACVCSFFVQKGLRKSKRPVKEKRRSGECPVQTIIYIQKVTNFHSQAHAHTICLFSVPCRHPRLAGRKKEPGPKIRITFDTASRCLQQTHTHTHRQLQRSPVPCTYMYSFQRRFCSLPKKHVVYRRACTDQYWHDGGQPSLSPL